MSQEVKKDGQQTNSGGSETKESDPAASDSCPLCAGKISLRILGPCVHPLCHKCGIKLRALYENMECPFCKVCIFGSVDYCPDCGLQTSTDWGSRKTASNCIIFVLYSRPRCP